jgi:hypothetical protein
LAHARSLGQPDARISESGEPDDASSKRVPSSTSGEFRSNDFLWRDFAPQSNPEPIGADQAADRVMPQGVNVGTEGRAWKVVLYEEGVNDSPGQQFVAEARNSPPTRTTASVSRASSSGEIAHDAIVCH